MLPQTVSFSSNGSKGHGIGVGRRIQSCHVVPHPSIPGVTPICDLTSMSYIANERWDGKRSLGFPGTGVSSNTGRPGLPPNQAGHEGKVGGTVEGTPGRRTPDPGVGERRNGTQNERWDAPQGRRGRRANGAAPGEGTSTRQRILQIALTLMSQKGVDATSMRDLASAAGLNVASLYHYFPSKRELLESVLVEHGFLPVQAGNPQDAG